VKKLMLVATAVLASATFTTPAAVAASGDVISSAHVAARHTCTHTSSGSCIRGGEFCPQSKYRQSGWDARGRRYVCKGDHTHPHWMLP